MVTHPHHHPFVKTVAAALADRCGVESGDRVVVAVSGGADSVALMHALHALAARPQWELDLHVAHINHKLRDDADEDERFVIGLADSLGLPMHRRELDLSGEAGNREAAARCGRYGALAAIAEQVDADYIAVAHHADDQLETMLMRLIRGAGVEGLSGMSWRRTLTGCDAKLIRPMLGLDRAAVGGFLEAMGQAWREDATNADVSRWRARLRAEVLPVLRDLRPDAAVKATQAADQLRAAAGLMNRRIERAIERSVALEGASAAVPREAARRLHPAVLRGLMRKISVRLGVPADKLGGDVVRLIAAAARDSSGEVRRFELAGGVRVTIDAEKVEWARYHP